MAFLKSGNASYLYNIIRCKTNGKLDWSDTLSQLKIYSKPVYSYTLEDMLSNFKNRVPQAFCLPALWPAIRPTSHRCMGSVFLNMQVIAV